MADVLGILLIEDSEVDRMAVHRALARAGLTAEVREAVTIQSALDALTDAAFDCVLLDYILPDGTALDFIAQARQMGSTSGPTIILTGRGGETVATELMQAGAVDYIPKAELTPSRLDQSIRNALRVHAAELTARLNNQRLQASEKRFRTLFENSPDAVLVEDFDGDVLDANPAASKLHGIRRSELIGMNKSQLKPPDQRDAPTGGFDDLTGGKVTGVEGVSWNRTTGGIPVEIRANPVEYDGKQAILLHVRDITELKAARDELERRVQVRTAELQAAYERLQEEMVEREQAEQRARQLQSQLAHAARLGTMGQMTATLAHELNQPLGAVTNYVRGSRRMLDITNPNVPAVQEALDKAGAQAERAGQIIHRLRNFVTQQPSPKTHADVSRLIAEVVDLLAGALRQNQIKLSVDVADGLPTVSVDAIQIQQVLVNLLQNAMDAMQQTPPAARQITIAADTDERGDVVIRISDTGAGADPNSIKQLCDPFFTTKPDGMGLGLSISNSIVETHGGVLTPGLNRQAGMTFSFNIPAQLEE